VVRVSAVARIRKALRARVRATGRVPEWEQQAQVAARLLAVVPGAGRRLTGHCYWGWRHWSPIEDGMVVLVQWPVEAAAVSPLSPLPLGIPLLTARSPRVLVAQCPVSPVSQACPVRRTNPVQTSHSVAVWRGLWPKLGLGPRAQSPGPGPRPPCPRKAAPAR
jgi:hypothetical protein